MWRLIFQELREVIWLASIIGGLSLVGILVGIALAAALVAGALPALQSPF